MHSASLLAPLKEIFGPLGRVGNFKGSKLEIDMEYFGILEHDGGLVMCPFVRQR